MSLGTDYVKGAYAPARLNRGKPWGGRQYLTEREGAYVLVPSPNESFTAYCQACAAEIAGNTSWRVGEVWFNVLADIRPDIADYISGSYYDCWQNDSVLEAFIEKVKALW